jgi:hypothetical protein
VGDVVVALSAGNVTLEMNPSLAEHPVTNPAIVNVTALEHPATRPAVRRTPPRYRDGAGPAVTPSRGR